MLTTSLFLLTAAASPQGPGTSMAPVVINEFSYDDSGANDRVFVELYNRSGAPVDISGWTLDGVDGSSVGNADVVIAAGTVLQPGGFYVVGQAAGVPNVDQDEPGMNTVLETGPDGLVLLDLGLNPVDGVTWEQANWTNPLPTWLEGDGLWGDIFNNDALPQSAARVFDGYDTDDNGCDFRVTLWSPGASNQGVQVQPLSYRDDFDGAPGTTVSTTAFSYSFVPGTTEDPAALGIPPSPQGGNCSVWYDPLGGGDANYYNAPARSNWLVECYAWLRGPEPNFDGDDVETWGMGVRGSTDSFGEPPDLGGLYAFLGFPFQAGITGVAWFQVITQTTSDLYLVDFNNGGADFTVLAGPIAIPTSGWQRLRLSVLDGDVVGNIGGTFGCDDGTRYTATGATVCTNGVYIQYRENVSASGAHRPLALDALRIAPNEYASYSVVGSGSPTTAGLPLIGTAGERPFLGNAAFVITGAGLVPGGTSLTALSLGFPTLPGTQLPGAPAGALSFLPNVLDSVLHVNTAAGSTTTALPIPCVTELANLPLGAQVFDLDPSLPAATPVGTSGALRVRVGTLEN